MKLQIIPLTILVSCLACQHRLTQEKIPTLEKIWETDTLLTANESAVYDSVTNAIYVSCMGNAEDIADGDGFIAKLTLEGKIENLHWVSGLNCPKGLALYDGKLFVIDINELVAIDLATGKVLSKEIVTAGEFFNDLDISPTGDAYMSESHTAEIIRYRNGESEVYFSSPETKGLNGVHVTDGGLMFTGSKGHIYELTKDFKTEVLADSCFNADGIERYRNGYFCSSWQGKIYYFETGKPTYKLIDTWADKQYAADIDVVEQKKVLICPTLMNNKVIGYRIVD